MSISIPDHIEQSDLVILDCDDVLLDYVGGLRLHILTHFGIPLDPAGPDDWSMRSWFGTDNDTAIRQMWTHFNEANVGNFHKIAPRDGAEDLVRSILTSGRRIEIVTSSTTSETGMQNRRENLANVFGEDAFADIHFVGAAMSKEAVLREMKPSIFIDDNPGHVETSIKCGHFGMLLSMRSNETLHDGNGSTPGGFPFLRSPYTAARIISTLEGIEQDAPVVA